jgi:hypothetical protein
MNTHEFDSKFDEGQEDITGHLDISKAKRPSLEQKRVSVDFPVNGGRRQTAPGT